MKCARCGTEARQLWLTDLCAACYEAIKSKVEHAVRYADIVAAVPSTAYEDSERENANLRATLEWLASKFDGHCVCSPLVQGEVLAELGKRLEDPATGAVDEHDALSIYAHEVERARLVQRAASHLEIGAVKDTGSDEEHWAKWQAEAGNIAAALRLYSDEPRKPIVLTARELARRAAKSSAHRTIDPKADFNPKREAQSVRRMSKDKE